MSRCQDGQRVPLPLCSQEGQVQAKWAGESDAQKEVVDEPQQQRVRHILCDRYIRTTVQIDKENFADVRIGHS